MNKETDLMIIRIAVVAAALALAGAAQAEEKKPEGLKPGGVAPAPAAPAAPAAQGQTSDRAPRAKATAAGVTIDYGRPSLNGRTLDALLAKLGPDRVWRTGVDQVTTLTAERDLMIGGKKVPAGKYSLYVHAPEKGDWSLIVNKDLGVPLKTIFAGASPAMANEPWPQPDYAKIADKEVARAALKKVPASPASELFTLALNPAPYGSDLRLTWGDASYLVDVR